MKALADYTNIHAHAVSGKGIITNLDFADEPNTTDPEARYSAGIHPWSTFSPLPPEVWQWLERMANHPCVVAIGECGLDALRGAAMPLQEEIFLRQAKIAAMTGKPLIVHCVRAWHRLLALRKLLPAEPHPIIHGFRGKSPLARQLLEAGFDLSFGRWFNSEAFEMTPPGRRFRETDTEKSVQIDSPKR